MDKIIVKEDGKLFFDDEEKQTGDLTPEVLIEIINNALDDKIEFDIEGSQPLASFFNTIKGETNPDAEFRKEIDALKKEASPEDLSKNFPGNDEDGPILEVED